MEVRPLLEVLVGKTMEQSLLEVMEEEELASLRTQQRAFQELRNAELVEVQRLEEQERRHREEKVSRPARWGRRWGRPHSSLLAYTSCTCLYSPWNGLAWIPCDIHLDRDDVGLCEQRRS